mmetsp:Transcript_19644/g.51643  ORF Transcript_19644/g.51643 Transcript_19644/m.51643 type:complete len:292 (+) Transcript_19644:3-878(+)
MTRHNKLHRIAHKPRPRPTLTMQLVSCRAAFALFLRSLFGGLSGAIDLPQLVVRTCGVLVVGAAEYRKHLVCPLIFLRALPLAVRHVGIQAISKLLSAPGQDKRRPAVVVLVEIDAAPLMLHHGVDYVLFLGGLPEHGVHDVEDPMPLENVQGCNVDPFDIRHIRLVQAFYARHILFLKVNEHLRLVRRRHGVADSARFEGAAGRCIQNADTALPAPKTAALIHVQLAAGARASETPILQLLLPDGRTLEQILVLQVRDGELVALFQRNSRSQHECIVFPIRPATRRVTRV